MRGGRHLLHHNQRNAGAGGSVSSTGSEAARLSDSTGSKAARLSDSPKSRRHQQPMVAERWRRAGIAVGGSSRHDAGQTGRWR